MAAMAMLLLNIWSTQDNTIYNFAVAGCNLLRTRRRKTVTLVGAVIGTLLAMLGMYDLLVPYLILLGTVIPPIGGVIMAFADFVFGVQHLVFTLFLQTRVGAVGLHFAQGYSPINSPLKKPWPKPMPTV